MADAASVGSGAASIRHNGTLINTMVLNALADGKIELSREPFHKVCVQCCKRVVLDMPFTFSLHADGVRRRVARAVDVNQPNNAASSRLFLYRLVRSAVPMPMAQGLNVPSPEAVPVDLTIVDGRTSPDAGHASGCGQYSPPTALRATSQNRDLRFTQL